MHQKETELLSIEPDFQWPKLNVDYQLVALDEFEQPARKEPLLLTAIHSANYYLPMMTAAAV